MKFEVRDAGNVKIVEIHGKHVLETTGPVKETVDQLVAGGNKRIVFDLRDVPWIDSSGIGELAGCKKRVLENDGKVNMIRRKGKYHLAVETMLELIFGPLFDDETKAVGSF